MEDKIFSLIDRIRVRPGMYLGSLSLAPLWHFINGYSFALRDLDYAYDCVLPLNFGFFTEFTQFYYKFDDNACWYHHILWHCEGDEKKALSEFFEVFDKFREISINSIRHAVLSEENILYNDSMEHCYSLSADEKYPMYINPVGVYVFGLSIDAFLLSVETKTDFRFIRQFFPSFERAVSGECIPEGAEVYFGKIDEWEELSVTDNIDELIGNKRVVY